ncbi:hypothetical protein FKM82_017844 [Ascaphus truei]
MFLEVRPPAGREPPRQGGSPPTALRLEVRRRCRGALQAAPGRLVFAVRGVGEVSRCRGACGEARGYAASPIRPLPRGCEAGGSVLWPLPRVCPGRSR